MQIADKYSPQEIESKWYDYWMEHGNFIHIGYKNLCAVRCRNDSTDAFLDRMGNRIYGICNLIHGIL